MSRQGRELERLIATLERLIGGSGLELKSPDYIMGIKSRGRREVDVAVRGKAGSADFLIVFECRKRKHKDDVTWIEQLASKAKDVRASKVVAVSSSGFSETAKTLAEQEGIELRSIESIGDLNLIEWGPFGGFGVIVDHADLFDAEVFGHYQEGEDPEQLWHALNSVLEHSDSGDAIFTRSFDNKKMTLTEIWDEALDYDPQVLKRFRPGDPPIAGKLTVQFLGKDPGEPRSRFYIQTETEHIHIAQITFYALFWAEKPKMLEPTASQYKKADGDSISKSLQYTAKLGQRELQVGVHRLDAKPNQVSITLEPVLMSGNQESKSASSK